MMITFPRGNEAYFRFTKGVEFVNRNLFKADNSGAFE